MLQTILSLYLQSLLLAAVAVIFVSLIWFFARMIKRTDKTLQARQEVLYDLLIINVMTIPIISFGIVGILLMLKA
ncbi:DUF4059 family protein [Streptococcus oriscaviae]|uniref:DUF4059 family protein n=1 Tax=Streptococcus oriscaviae TaxID=2781599 RepID=A0ABX7YLE0_9STRE|nr:DUF4059 family protein [Streptococcus oriscaviae]QUE54094.1 DUF4059 family protein [Streptococcus oriscaviae]